MPKDYQWEHHNPLAFEEALQKEKQGHFGALDEYYANYRESVEQREERWEKQFIRKELQISNIKDFEEYKKDPRLATLRQQDDDRQLLARAEAQKKEMMEFEPTEVLPFRTKPLSSLVFKTAPLNPKTNSRVEPVSYTNIETNSKKLKKKSYGGNLAMLKYMK